MVVDNLVKEVQEISEQTSYWFVRTDYGQYFDIYFENGFIAIGWDNITLEEIQKEDSKESVRKKILISEGLDSSLPKTKGKITSIINKLQTFVNLKKGDVIIMPSRNSSRYAFGIVESSIVDINIDKGSGCDYHKRKKVKWICTKTMAELDPHFYTMRFTQHIN